MKPLIAGMLLLSLVACEKEEISLENNDNTKLRELVSNLLLTGSPLTTEHDIPNIADKEAQLGMELFFSKSMGADQDSACVTCHHPSLGGGDNLSLPIGTESDEPDLLGVGRNNQLAANNSEGGPPVPRNAPTTFNTALWDQFMFHDGRVESLAKIVHANGVGDAGIRTPNSTSFGVADPLAGQNLVQAQARFPVTSREEMKGFSHDSYSDQTIREFLAGRIGGYGDAAADLIDTDYWLTKFRDVFDSPAGTAVELVTEQNISFVIGEYERSQVFVNNPWKQYVEGNDDAISEEAKAGAILFFSTQGEGGANCASCHAGDFFTNESFHNVAMPQLGSGKGDGDDGSKDFGRFRETGNALDKFAFRTPSLLNVEVTGPWSHAGAYTSLQSAVRHMLNPQKAINEYDFNQLNQTDIRNLDQLVVNTQEARDAANFEIEEVNFSDKQVDDIVAFLQTLTDPCVKDRECLAAWIPDSTVISDPNGDQLNAVDVGGDLY
ncbi:MAG: cytochrome-c peroxidase [Methyloprofundus sp.]|nr:cytochrome-c peroxidase [Methyloprofundus sp.]